MDYKYSRSDLDGASDSRYARERDDYRASDSYRDRRSDRRDRNDRDRRRSRSPLPVDRYQPLDRVPRDRDDYYSRRERRRSSPDRMGAGGAIDRYVPNQPEPPQLLSNPLPDPLKLEFQVGFTWFAEWWRTEQ